MSYAATALRVMIASPGDVPEARDAVEKAIYGWNEAYSMAKGVILQPWRWETAAVPIMGGHPQSLINSQGVDQSDIVFALFGGRLGTPTPEAMSGTAEEITRALEAGTPVHLYFSKAPLPSDIDTAQLEALREFRADMESRGLLGSFSSASQLEHEVWKAIELDIAGFDLANVEKPRTGVAVEFAVQPQQEREMSGFSNNGSPKYTTRTWIDVRNTGFEDAENVVIESVGDDSGLHLPSSDRPTTIHAGQTRNVPTFHTWGGDGAEIIRITWTENGETKSRDFHVG